MVVLVSPNNFGKSNLLQAIDFGADYLLASTNARRRMMKWRSGIPLTPACAFDDYWFEIELDAPSLGEYRYVRYGFSFTWFKDDGTGQKITNEWLDARKSESVKYSSFLQRNEGTYRKGYSTQARRKVVLDDAQLSIDVLAAIDDIEIANVIMVIKSFTYHVCASLDLQDSFSPAPFEFLSGRGGGMCFDDSDVPTALALLHENFPKQSELFVEAVFTLFPEFSRMGLQKMENNSDEQIHFLFARSDTDKRLNAANEQVPDIPFRLRDVVYKLIIESDFLNQPIDVDSMSAGTKRLIWLLAKVFVSGCTGVSFLAVEEMETSIHPRLLKSLVEILVESTEEIRIIVTSHSPFLVQYMKMHQLYLGIPDDTGAATFRKISASKSKNLVNTARNLGVSVGEYLFELMAGDSDSTRILNQYLEEPVRDRV